MKSYFLTPYFETCTLLNISVRNFLMFFFSRFTDEVHFKGGALVGSQMLSWAAVMFTWNARAPNPEQFGKLAFF